MPKGIYTRTEKNKKNMSKSRLEGFRIGTIKNWNKGLTKETDKRILDSSIKSGLSRRGRKQSEEHIEKRVSKIRGKKMLPFTEKHLDNLSKSHKGMKAWNKNIKGNNFLSHYKNNQASFKGHKHSEENIEKMRLRKLGKKITDITKEKMSLSHKKIKKTKEQIEFIRNLGLSCKGKKVNDKEKERLKNIRKFLVIPKKDTSIEVKIQNFLKELKIEFLTHQYMNIEHGYQCDILIPSKNIVIECFGTYWHKYPLARPIDTTRCVELRKAGYKVLVFWENEIRLMQLQDLKNKLEIIEC